jgi:hypothetical protein
MRRFKPTPRRFTPRMPKGFLKRPKPPIMDIGRPRPSILKPPPDVIPYPGVISDYVGEQAKAEQAFGSAQIGAGMEIVRHERGVETAADLQNLSAARQELGFTSSFDAPEPAPIPSQQSAPLPHAGWNNEPPFPSQPAMPMQTQEERLPEQFMVG